MNVVKENILYTPENMVENRKRLLTLFTDMKGKFLKGYFTIENLILYYKYSINNANIIIDLLARNGFLNLDNSGTTKRYYFENDKTKQIENIEVWKQNTENELIYYNLAIETIKKEICTEEN